MEYDPLDKNYNKLKKINKRFSFENFIEMIINTI